MEQPSSLLKNCSGSRLPLTPGPHSSGSLSAPAWPGAGFLLDISHLPSRPSPSFLPSQPSCPRASVPAHWTADSPVSASPPACPVLSLLAAASWTLAWTELPLHSAGLTAPAAVVVAAAGPQLPTLPGIHLSCTAPHPQLCPFLHSPLTPPGTAVRAAPAPSTCGTSRAFCRLQWSFFPTQPRCHLLGPRGCSPKGLPVNCLPQTSVAQLEPGLPAASCPSGSVFVSLSCYHRLSHRWGRGQSVFAVCPRILLQGLPYGGLRRKRRRKEAFALQIQLEGFLESPDPLARCCRTPLYGSLRQENRPSSLPAWGASQDLVSNFKKEK